MNIQYAASALEDLDAIDIWISRDSPERAISFVRELQDVIEGLVDGPGRFPLLDADRYPDVHRRNYRDYRILYRVSADAIMILHVHQGRRDTPDL